MKITHIIAVTLTLIAAQSLRAQTITADNFNSYAIGSGTPSSTFPSAVPTYGGTWTVSATGTATVQDGAAYSAASNVMTFTQNGSGQTPLILLNLPSAYSGTDTWTASIDLRVPVLGDTGGFTLLSINSSINRLGTVGMFTSGGTNYLFFGASTVSAGGVTDFQNFGIGFSLNTWYTVTLSGNNATQVISASVTGFSAPASRFYNTNVSSFNRVILGDLGGNGLLTTAVVDNFSLTAVPEPSTSVMLIVGAALLLGRFRKKSRVS